MDKKLCARCGRNMKSTITYRQNTHYPEESANYVTLCRTCKKYNDQYWKEMWQEYWSSVL